MKKKRLTIKFKLTLFVVVLSTLLVFTGIWIVSSIMQLSKLNQITRESSELSNAMLKLRKSEKDFLLRETSNETFFETKTSKYLDNFVETIEIYMNNVERLDNNKLIRRMHLTKQMDQLAENMMDYKRHFEYLVDMTIIRGYKDNGEIGQMRQAVREVEQVGIKTLKNDALRAQILMLRRHEKDYLLRRDTVYADKLNAAVITTKKLMDKMTLNRTVKRDLMEKLDIYQTSFAHVVSTDESIGRSQTEGIKGDMRRAVHQIEPLIEEVVAVINTKSATIRSRTVSSLIIAIVALIVLASGVLTLISRSIIKSVKTAQDAVNAMSKGKIVNTIVAASDDEMGDLLQDMGVMTGKLKQIITGIMQASDSITSVGNDINEYSQQLAEGTSELASSLEEVSSSMEEITANIEQTAGNSKETEAISYSASDGIKTVHQASSKSLEWAKDIAEKVKIIDTIANQTNILALNAAVEAAKAQVDGRGFAVVAREVKKLAEKSREAASRIIHQAEAGMVETQQSVAMLEQVLPDIHKTSQLVQEITVAGSEQTTGTMQINEAIRMMNVVTQNNAATAQELQNISENLASRAIELKEVISFFVIGDTKTIAN